MPYTTWSRQFTVLLMLICAFLLQSCSSGAPAQSPTAEDPALSLADEGLPALGDVAKTVLYTAGRFRRGSDYHGEYAQRVKASPCGAVGPLTFMPVPEEGHYLDPENVAWAIYSFNLPGYDDTAELHIQWQTEPAGGELWFVGLSDWDSGSWHWLPGTDGPDYDLGSLDPYMQDGRIVVAVVVGGPTDAVLSRMFFGSAVDGLTITHTGYDELTNTNYLTLEYTISGTAAPFTVDLDSNFYESYSGGDPLASFWMNPPISGQRIEDAAPTGGLRSVDVEVVSFGPLPRVFAVRVTDDLGDEEIIWNSTPQPLEFTPHLVITDFDSSNAPDLTVSLLYQINNMGRGPFQVDLCYDFRLLDGYNLDLCFVVAEGQGTTFLIRVGDPDSGEKLQENVGPFEVPPGEYCLAIRITDMETANTQVLLADRTVSFE